MQINLCDLIQQMKGSCVINLIYYFSSFFFFLSLNKKFSNIIIEFSYVFLSFFCMRNSQNHSLDDDEDDDDVDEDSVDDDDEDNKPQTWRQTGKMSCR